jgi:hypothetical protein
MQRSGEITAAPGSLSLVDAIIVMENSQQREALAMERLGFSETIHQILKHTLETTSTTAMEDAVEVRWTPLASLITLPDQFILLA